MKIFRYYEENINKGIKCFYSRTNPAFVCISSMVFTILLMFCFLFAISRPIDLQSISIQNVNGTVDSYAFDLNLACLNPNLIPIKITRLNLDIFTSIADPDPKKSQGRRELLAHVDKFEKRYLTFPPCAISNSSGWIYINDPANSLGKLIYLSPPYQLSIVGSLKYTFFGDLLEQRMSVCQLFHISEDGVVSAVGC